MHLSRRFGADQFKVIVEAIKKTKIAGFMPVALFT
jgi:hypothetical protein